MRRPDGARLIKRAHDESGEGESAAGHEAGDERRPALRVVIDDNDVIRTVVPVCFAGSIHADYLPIVEHATGCNHGIRILDGDGQDF